jgi:hypothetical protein
MRDARAMALRLNPKRFRRGAMRKPMMWFAAGIVTLTCSSQAFGGPTFVSCGLGQRAIVRNAFVRGETVTRVDCVGSGYRTAAYRTARYRTERRHRSWQKSALIIGGSTATGAGIGGIVHGKSGALIGAALGGGASSIYEGARRR